MELCALCRELIIFAKFKLKATSNNRNMKDVKDILDEAQEKMDMAVMYLEESLAHSCRESRCSFAGRYPR